MKTLSLFSSPEYCVPGSKHETLQKSAWVAASLTRRPIAGVELIAPDALTREELAVVHTERYLEAILTGKPRWQAQSQGFEWAEALWTAAATSSGGVVEAALVAEARRSRWLAEQWAAPRARRRRRGLLHVQRPRARGAGGGVGRG